MCSPSCRLSCLSKRLVQAHGAARAARVGAVHERHVVCGRGVCGGVWRDVRVRAAPSGECVVCVAGGGALSRGGGGGRASQEDALITELVWRERFLRPCVIVA
jgi:hypothetical protein